LSEDDADDEDEEESLDSEEEEEEHLAPTVPAPAQYSSVSASEETEPFDEGETAATPPPFGYRIAARISVQPHIFMPFCSESEVERLLAIPTPPLSPVSLTSYTLPPLLMPLPIFTPLPTSLFPLPSSIPSTSGSESILKADIPLRKRARFTTPTSRYEIGESSVAAAARQIRPTLTIADTCRANDKLIGRLRRERRYFRTMATTYAQEVAYSRDYCTRIIDYCQSRESEEDSIEYSTSGGDDDADDDGDDLLEDDADAEEDEESSDNEDEEEDHLAPTVPAPALHSSIPAFKDSDETEPFEKGKTAATPPPFGYRVAARISVQPHILMPFRSESEVERLLSIPTPPLFPVSPTSYPLPPFLMPLPIFTLLHTSSFPESIPEADIPLRKRALFTTPTGGYEVGESSIAIAARQIRPALTIADRRRADDRLIGRLRRERRYFRTLSTTYAQKKTAPKRTTRSTQVPSVTPAPTATTTTVTEAQLQALIDQGVAAVMAEAEASRVRNGYDSNSSGPRLAQTVREYTYPDFLKCQPLNFKGTEGVIELTQWFEKIESVFNISNCTTACQVKYAVCTLQGVALTWWNSHVKTVTLEVAQALPWKTLKKMMTDKYCLRGEIKKLETEMWELKTKGTDVIGYSRRFQEYAVICDRTFPEESDRVEKYIGGVPDTIHDSVKVTKPKTMQEATEFSTELMDKRIRDAVENKQKFEGTSGNNQNQPQQNKRQNTGRAYTAGNSDRNMAETTMLKQGCMIGNAGANPDNIVAEIADGRIIGLNTIMRDCTLNFLNHPFNIDLLPVELGSFDVIVGMDWLSKYDAVIACAEKLVCIPFGNEILTIHEERSNERNESRLNIISCSKAQEYMSKGCHVFLANITSTKDEDKSKGKQLKDAPVVREFLEVFPEDLPVIPPT
nr:hypothetical protein [Tanacetum cinerariifolium]